MDGNERQSRVAREAADWWLVLQGDASRPQREQYVDWLRESPSHVAEMLRVAQVHGALEQFQGWPAISTGEPYLNQDNVVGMSEYLRSHGLHDTRAKTPGPRRRFGRVVGAVAAALLLASAGAIVMQFRDDTLIRTERGERREIALADGSVVQIDPETRLRVTYRAHERRVLLETGRALFHVAKNPGRPFLVQANETTVRAVGTAFAVEKSANESLIVTVSEGTVAVFPTESETRRSNVSPEFSDIGRSARESSQNSGKPTFAGSIPGRTHHNEQQSVSLRGQLLVTAGEQVAVDSSGPESVHAVDSARALAWAEGRLIFDNSSVTDAVSQFNRYNRIQIIVNDATLARKVINGTFNAADPESFAAFMQSVARVRIVRNERADIALETAN